MIIERLLILFGAALSILVLLSIFKQQQLKKARAAATSMENSANEKTMQLIYFWSTQCSQCKTAQSPVIDSVIKTVGEKNLTITKVNINESPTQAKAWGIKTIPSTYVLDADGHVIHMNNGFATEKTLLAQIVV